MTGKFELVETSHGAFEFRLISHTGKVLAVSGTYSDKDSAPLSTKSRHDHGAPSRWFG